MKRYLVVLALMSVLGCQKKSKNQDDPVDSTLSTTTATIDSTSTASTTTETPATTDTSTPVTDDATDTTTPEASTAPTWTLTAENCAAWGMGYDPMEPNCLNIADKATCDGLANGSKFVLRFGVGECLGPNLQASDATCALEGKIYDQDLNSCQTIDNQADCEGLANGSVWDVGYERCVGMNRLPSVENCAAYGDGYDTMSGKCVEIRVETECTDLNSDAVFDVGYERCMGRCDYRDSILDICYRKR